MNIYFKIFTLNKVSNKFFFCGQTYIVCYTVRHRNAFENRAMIFLSDHFTRTSPPPHQ